MHHSVPRHVLARFANDDGRLTVIRKEPELKLLRRQRPENVGVHRRLNSWQQDDGTWNDEIERGPLDRLDSVGSVEIDDAIAFAISNDAEAHMRLLDADLDRRATLQLFVASLMVRVPEIRETLDDNALPSLIAQMLANLTSAEADGSIDPQTSSLLRTALMTSGRVRLDAPPTRHVAALVPLIEAVAYRLHLGTLVAVRRFDEPLLLTGSQPVVVFPTHEITSGTSSATYLGDGPDASRMWDTREDLLEAADDRIAALAGAAIALDPRTLLVMFNPDSEEGAKLAFVTSQVAGFALAGVVNTLVIGGSRWIAGRDDCELLTLLARSTPRA